MSDRSLVEDILCVPCTLFKVQTLDLMECTVIMASEV